MVSALNLLPSHHGKPLLCITHSDRPMELDKCHLNYLEARYARSDRLPPSTPFEALTASTTHSPYGGQVSIYDLAAGWQAARLVCVFRPADFKPQHAIWHNRQLWVLGVECLDVYDSDLSLLVRIADPWLAGAHTIAPNGRGQMLVSCAASDAVLEIDCDSHQVIDARRVPEKLYGRNYTLVRSQSVVAHYITNDLQLAHVNCAWPFGNDGILISALIPGALGVFSADGSYRELLRGFVGCHGARVRKDTGGVYFADSCTGTLVLLDEQNQIERRIATDSRWLHDAVQVSDDIFAVALYDKMAVEFWNAATWTRVGQIDCQPHGGPQFLMYGQ